MSPDTNSPPKPDPEACLNAAKQMAAEILAQAFPTHKNARHWIMPMEGVRLQLRILQRHVQTLLDEVEYRLESINTHDSGGLPDGGLR